MPASVASLDTISSDDSYDSTEEERLALLEWEESLEQRQQLFAIVLLPFFGGLVITPIAQHVISTPGSVSSSTG